MDYSAALISNSRLSRSHGDLMQSMSGRISHGEIRNDREHLRIRLRAQEKPMKTGKAGQIGLCPVARVRAVKQVLVFILILQLASVAYAQLPSQIGGSQGGQSLSACADPMLSSTPECSMLLQQEVTPLQSSQSGSLMPQTGSLMPYVYRGEPGSRVPNYSDTEQFTCRLICGIECSSHRFRLSRSPNFRSSLLPPSILFCLSMGRAFSTECPPPLLRWTLLLCRQTSSLDRATNSESGFGGK